MKALSESARTLSRLIKTPYNKPPEIRQNHEI